MQNVAFHHPEIQNRVFCLYRVSTLGQVDKLRDDIPMQRQACHAYIAQQGWHFVDELSEKGVSDLRFPPRIGMRFRSCSRRLTARI